MDYTIHQKAIEMLQEASFELFKHEGLLCCVQRMGHGGNLNGYVALEEGHPLYGKNYDDKVVVKELDDVKFNGNYIGLLIASLEAEQTEAGILSIDMALNAHGGITYAREYLCGVADDVFGKRWWFGFDTAHAGDLRPYQSDIDRQYPIRDDEYRNFEYVKAQTIHLADQLNSFTQSKINTP